MLVCKMGAAFEIDWWWFGGVSVDIIHSSFRACMHCVNHGILQGTRA